MTQSRSICWSGPLQGTPGYDGDGQEQDDGGDQDDHEQDDGGDHDDHCDQDDCWMVKMVMIRRTVNRDNEDV